MMELLLLLENWKIFGVEHEKENCRHSEMDCLCRNNNYFLLPNIERHYLQRSVYDHWSDCWFYILLQTRAMGISFVEN